MLIVPALLAREVGGIVAAEPQFRNRIGIGYHLSDLRAITIEKDHLALSKAKPPFTNQQSAGACLGFEIVHPVGPAPALPPGLNGRIRDRPSVHPEGLEAVRWLRSVPDARAHR